MPGDADGLFEPWTFRFPYQRSTGPVVGSFLDGLTRGKILGLRMRDGGVLVPPHAHDPRTAETLDDWVEVGPEGTVTTWTWVARPLPEHPLDHPFAFGLVQLDGAATGMLHAVDAGDVDRMRTGLRVRVRWARDRRGHITDIACFEPVDAPIADEVEGGAGAVSVAASEPIGARRFEHAFASDYTIRAGRALSIHLAGLARGELVGLRGPSGNVYLPPNGADPISGGAVTEPVVLPDTGTVVRYCVVNIPVRGQQIDVPFAAADVLIDGADTTFMALIQGIPFDQVRLGLRVRAVWVDDDQLAPSADSIRWFEPTGEPDADLAALEAYL